MSRLLFTIVSSTCGWQLYEGEEGRYWFARWHDALETADIMASAMHQQQGIPTAVVMDMAGRESVMVSAHG
jgi:hypothetical protein